MASSRAYQAAFHGGASTIKLAAPFVGITATSDWQGYWLVTSNGAVYPYGDAHNYGGASAVRLAAPIVGIAATPDGLGYWLVGSKGAVYGYGDAGNYGGTSASKHSGAHKRHGGLSGSRGLLADRVQRLCLPIRSSRQPRFGLPGSPRPKWSEYCPSPDGGGYLEAAANGAVYAYGDAVNHGSAVASDARPSSGLPDDPAFARHVGEVFLIVAGGLFFGLVAALTLSQWHAGRAFAAVTATCTSDSSGNVTVTLNNDSTVQLTVGTSSSTNFLQLVGASSPNCEPAASVASITFALGTSTGPVTVILNETGTAPIPCVPFEGTIGGNTLQVNLAANDVANFGTTGADVNLSTGTSCAATDTLSGISAETAVATAAPVMVGANGGADGSPSAVTFTASPSANTYSLAGDVDLVGSAGTYTIASTGAGNAVNAGSGSETFAISGNGVDVTAGSGTDTFTLTGNNDSVMGGTGTDTFTVKGSGTAILAVSGGTYTVNNSGTGTVVTGGPGTESFTITGNTAPFTGSAGGTYTLNLPAGSDVTAGSGTETFTITDPAGGYTLTGSSDPAATTTFTVQGTPTTSAIGDALEGGAGTTSFTLNGNGNTLDGSSGPTTFNVTGNDNSYLGGTGTDQVTITGNSNDFHAGPGSEKFFGVAGSPGTNPGDTADFSGIGASSSAPLVVNLSGASETVQGVLVLNGEATLIPSSGSTYTFRDSSSASTALDFTTIIGSGEGNTQFLAGSSGGLTFTGSGSGNQVSFLGNSGVVVNVSGALQTTSAQIGSTKLSGFQIGSGQALVAPPTGSATSCSGSGGSAIASFCDVITDVFTATGPPSGFSTFYAGAPGQTYTFSDAGNNNTFIGGTGTAVFSSGGNFNTFEAGLGTESFSESTTSQEPDNTIDFSNVPVGSQAGCTSTPCSLSVNVSGTQTSVPDFSAALFNSSQAQVAIYSFGQGGSDFTNFIGAAGGDTAFAGGSGNYTYTGQGIGNTLDFSDVPPATATALTFDVTHTPSPQATLGTVPETFSGITNLVGLATGNTTFVGGSTGGYTFNGKGSGNQATFSTQGPSTTLTVQINQTGTNTPVTSGTVTFSLAGGPPCAPPSRSTGRVTPAVTPPASLAARTRSWPSTPRRPAPR